MKRSANIYCTLLLHFQLNYTLKCFREYFSFSFFLEMVILMPEAKGKLQGNLFEKRNDGKACDSRSKDFNGRQPCTFQMFWISALISSNQHDSKGFWKLELYISRRHNLVYLYTVWWLQSIVLKLLFYSNLVRYYS